MQNHKLFKRIISAALSMTTASQFLMAVLPQSVFAVSLNTDYVIYSDEDVTINTYKAVLNGNIFSGDDFTYLGNDTCIVNKSLNADHKKGNINVSETVDTRTVKPDYTSQLKNGVDYRTIYQGDSVINATEYDLTGSVYAKGKLRIDRTSFSGKGYIRAKNNILYNAVQNAENSEIFLYSEKGSITLQGSDLTVDGIIYAPEGTVEINAKNLTLNGTIVAKNVEFNGTNLTVNEIKDKSTSLIQFGPDLTIKGSEEVYKENRRISLDISDSFGIGDIDTDSLNWTFTAENYENSDCIRIDEETSTQLVKNLIITQKGTYRVNITGRDKDGNIIKYYDLIEVVEDLPPTAGFWKEAEVVERDAEGKAEIILEDTSYSLDGDEIGSRVWSVLIDTDNDGDFYDEKEEIFSSGNETKVTYVATSVGKYRFRLHTAEVFEDTIPSLISEDAYKIDSTEDMNPEATDVEVVNNGPDSYSGISKAKNVDIVVTVGNSDLDDIDALNKNVKQIKLNLESKGYSVNLSTVSTSTLTAKDTFAWDEYDHYNYVDSYLPTLDKHILFEGDSIKMVGYSWAPIRDWLFVDDGIKAKRILSFDMVRDKTDWHSMEGGGFLFNTTIRDEIQMTEDETAEPAVIKKMDGYCIILTSSGFKLVQLNDLDVESFRNGGVSGSIQAAGKVLLSVPVADVYDNYNIKIIASNRILSVYINDEPLIDNFVLPDTLTGTGFGPIICHGGHGCGQQSYFTFSNIKMTTVNGSELSEVLDKFKWRDSAEHYVLNLSKQSVFDLNNEESVGSAVKSLIEKKTNFVGLGTSDSKNQYNLLLKSTDGVYMDWYDILKNENMLNNYIFSDLAGVDYSIGGDMITTSDEIVYDNYYVDKENDPIGEQFWEYDLDSSVYENSSKESGVFVSENPLGTLEATGLYKIQSRLRDDPTNGNEALKPYQKWSNEVQWTNGLYVHSLPTASIGSKVFATDDPEKFLTELTFEAQDVDGLSHKNSGITEERYEWKCVDDSEWTEGKVPALINPEKVYLQKYTVCDEQGAWSVPCVEIVYAEKTENTEMFADDLDPELELTVSDENPCVDDEIIISASATDNTEVAYVNISVNGKLIAGYQGSVIYKCETEGEYVITADCKDIAGNQTIVTKTITVSDRRDLTAPEIIIDVDKDIVLSDKTLVISGYIYDNVQLDSYKVEYAPSGSETYTQVAESSSEVRGDTIASFSLPGEGTYTVLITALDKAGNTAYSRITLNVNQSNIDDTQVQQTTEAPEAPERVDNPAEITITASADKAEIGDVVIVKAEAADKDGLVSVKVFKDDALIAESPVEFRFSEAEAKIVTIRVETVDSNGGTGQKTLNIIIEDNRDKVMPTAEITAPAGGTTVSGKTVITGSAFDETGMRLYTLEYKKSDEKSYTTICSSLSERHNAELGVWDTYVLDNGVYDLRLSVTDNGGNCTTYSLQYAVENGGIVNEDQLTEELIVFTKPEPNMTADDVIKIEAQIDPTLQGKEYEIIIQGSGDSTLVKEGTVTADGSISAVVDSSMYPDGVYTITVAVKSTDADGADNSVKRESDVIVKHNYVSVDDKYDCEITSPAEMDELTCKTDVHAKVSEYVFNKYKFEYSKASKNCFNVFSTGEIRSETDIVGAFDTTLMENGYYDIRFTAYGDGIMASDTITVNVTGNLKIGNFSISFDDLEAEVNGVPITVTSTYDSRTRTNSGALGYGWNMTYSNVKLSISADQSRNWVSSTTGSSFITSYCLAEQKKHRITVDLGNGEPEEFAMKISPESQIFYPLQYGISAYYVSTSGTGSTLVPCDMSAGDLIYNGGILYNSDFSEYNPQRFVYKTADGSEYEIDAEKGLISTTTSGGDKISFNDNGIVCTGENLISYKHDGNGRITEISTNTGRGVSYEYDIFGDLVAVTDVSGYKKTFAYSKHYLTDIYTSDGVRAARNEYDDEGRLVKTIDADGNAVVYEHDVDGREETVKDRNGGVTRYVYDDKGNVLSKTDPMGNTVKSSYDANGKLASKTDALGNTTTYKYDANGKLVETANAEGIITKNTYNSMGLVQTVNVMGIDVKTYSYDSKGRLVSRTDANGNSTEYGYTDGNQLASITDEIGSYVNITYNSNGKPLSATNGDGTVSTYVYDADGRCTSRSVSYTEDGENKQITISYTYDEAGRVISTVDSDGNVITTEYNAAGKPVVETNKNGGQTRYTYDKLGNVSRITYPDGTSESFTYDKNGNNITAVDRAGRTATMTYDKVGNLLSKTYSSGAEKTYKYDSNYRLIEETASNGGVKRYEYDGIGRNTAVIDALGNRTEYTYTAQSNIATLKDAKGNVYKYTYDNNGNLIKTEYPDGTASSSEYNERGLIVGKTDQNGNTQSYEYDKLNRLSSVTDAMGGKTTYEYDEIGNLIRQTDSNGNATNNSYDEKGRLIKSVNAMGQTAEYTYDKNGNILSYSDFGGKVTSYTYDRSDRIVSKVSGNERIYYSYSRDGKLIYVNDKLGRTSYTYDANDGLINVTYPNGKYIEYINDSFGRKTGIKTDYGTTLYTYDLLDRILSVTDRHGNVTSYEYDANGNRSAVKYADGITVTYEYDKLNRLVNETAVDADGNTIASYEYTVGKSGEITRVKEPGRDIYYEYDNLYRLVSEKIVSSNLSTDTYTYTYDKAGNRTSKTVNGKKTVYTYNALNQLTGGDGITYLYDASGNLVSEESAVSVSTYKYNNDNMLIEADVNGVVEEYQYDYAGNRVSKKSETDYTYYLNDLTENVSQVLEEYDADGNVKCRYTRGVGLISQERDKVSYYLSDGHDSVRQLADTSGVVTDTYSYDAWGNMLTSSGSTPNTYYYCGEQLDGTTGYYYLRARYMNPSTGTFTTLDTFQGTFNNPITLNKYLYANANPVMYTDPTGHFGLVSYGLGMIFSHAFGNIMSLVMNSIVENMFKNIFANYAYDEAEDYEPPADGGRTLDTFEELFNFNNILITLNFEIICLSMIIGSFKIMLGEVSNDADGLVDGVRSTLDGAMSLAAAYQQRFDLYDFIFDYAMGTNGYMDRMKTFTEANAKTLAATINGFATSFLKGDASKGAGTLSALETALDQLGNIVNGNNPTTLDVYAIIQAFNAVL